MRPFDYHEPIEAARAVALASVPAEAANRAPVQYLAGGTTMLDLMKLDVMRPETLVDVTRLDGERLRRIRRTDAGLRIGSLVTMAEMADDRTVARDYPLLSQSLRLAASPQLRNMATVAGNALQRTRCSYFRDPSYAQCNKRQPGSGCAALDGHNRLHAVLGTSPSCIASYPGDWAQAMVALDAVVEVIGAGGPRSLRFADLHRLPGETPHLETTLAPGELITGFVVPGEPWRRSLYRKVRDRESYAFANASAAVALDLNGETVRDVRIGLGGVATIPWRAAPAEASLKGRPLTEATAQAAADAEFGSAVVRKHNAFKAPLGRATLVRALMEAKGMEVDA